MTESVGHIV